MQGVAQEAWEPGEGGEPEERWCNGEETVLAVSQALIKPEAGSQGGRHWPCGTASRASVFGHALGFSLQADLHPLQKGGSRGQDWDQQVWPIPVKLAALQHGWRAEQGRSPLGAALAVPQLCLGHTQLPTPLLSPLTGLCAARHGHLRMK